MRWSNKPTKPGGMEVTRQTGSMILQTGSVGTIRMKPIQKSKLCYDALLFRKEEYVVAPTDIVSLEKSLLKWRHPQGYVTVDEFERLVTWMDHEFGGYIKQFEVPTLKELATILDGKKSAGYPYNDIYGPFKSQTLAALSLGELISDFVNYDQIVEATRKDEVRLKGKSFRVILGSPVSCIAAGALLFHKQNESLVEARFNTASAVGISTPGGEAYMLWHGAAHRRAAYRQSDGAANDSHFSTILAQVLCEFRKLHMPKKYHPLVERYYKVVFNFRASFLGQLQPLQGMQTGQFNTLIDNSLGNIAVRMLAVIRDGGSYEDFRALGLKMMGDDAIECGVGYKLPLNILDDTHTSLFMYVEVPRDEEKFLDLKFIGMHPVIRSYKGKDWLMYSYDAERILTSINYVKKNMSYGERFAKLVGLAGLVWADKATWKVVKHIALDYYERNHALLDHRYLALRTMLNSSYQFRFHIGF